MKVYTWNTVVAYYSLYLIKLVADLTNLGVSRYIGILMNLRQLSWEDWMVNSGIRYKKWRVMHTACVQEQDILIMQMLWPRLLCKLGVFVLVQADNLDFLCWQEGFMWGKKNPCDLSWGGLICDQSTTQPSPSKIWYFAGSNFISSRYFPFVEKRDSINEVVEDSSEMLFPSTLDK
jgi:hypothetical protein